MTDGTGGIKRRGSKTVSDKRRECYGLDAKRMHRGKYVKEVFWAVYTIILGFNVISFKLQVPVHDTAMSQIHTQNPRMCTREKNTPTVAGDILQAKIFSRRIRCPLLSDNDKRNSAVSRTPKLMREVIVGTPICHPHRT